MPTRCVSIYEMECIQAKGRAKRTAAAQRRLKRKTEAGVWAHLHGDQIERISGNNVAPPYRAEANLGLVAEGMDGKQWQARPRGWVRV